MTRISLAALAGASFIRCYYAAHLSPSVHLWYGTAADLTTANRAATSRAAKMSRKLNRFVASPACIAGVRVALLHDA